MVCFGVRRVNDDRSLADIPESGIGFGSFIGAVPATGVLVETLLDRGAESDVAEAEAVIERLAGRASR